MTERELMIKMSGVMNEAKTPLTIANVNKEAKKLGYELVKGKGYFYFTPIDASKTDWLYDDSVMVYKLTDIPTVEKWIQILKDKIKDTF